MRRTIPSRGVAFATLALLVTLLPATAGDTKPKKKKVEPPPAKDNETVGTIATLINGEINVEGVGLVMGLNNTGSDPSPSAQRTKLLDDMRKAGVEHPDRFLADPGCSMVIVKAVLPHGLGKKDPIDVEISLPPASGTTSLAGGHLLVTELAPIVQTAQGTKWDKVLAIASGPIMTGDLANPNNLKAGRVLGGARVKNDVPYSLVVKEDRKSARSTKMVEDQVKVRFHQSDGLDQKGLATAKTDNLLVLKVPKVYHHNQSRYFQVVERLPLVDTPVLRAQRMQNWGKELLDPKKSGQAALKLEGLGANSIPILKEGLASVDPQVKFFSAESLAYLGSVDGADVLAETASTREEFRSYALKALAAMDQAAGLMRLRTLMGRPEIELRYGAFDALRSFDPDDPALGQVSLLEPEKVSEEDADSLAMQIDETPRRRRRPARQEPFKLYVVDTDGPPLVHITKNLRAEVVIFGKGQKLLTPVVLGAGGAVLLNASEGDDRLQISRITADKLDAPESRIVSSLVLADAVRNAVRAGATYPDVVNILTGASSQKNLSGPLVVDAIPMPNKSYTEVQLLGSAAKKDDAVKKAGSESTKRPSFLDRIRGRSKP